MRIVAKAFFAGFLILTMLSVGSEGWTQSKSDAKAPVITNSYAASKGRYGTVWRIYVEAKDTDPEMSQIAVVVDQPGYGRYPTDFILLDPQYRNQFKGFLQWNTFSSKGAVLKEGVEITLRISVIERGGAQSKEVVFPFTFISGVREQEEVPTTFDEGNVPRLGYISIDLVSPQDRF